MGSDNTRQVASKWLKTSVLLSDPLIAKHIPSSRLYNAVNLRSMLSLHNMVVLKPIRGGGGVGVMKVTRTGRSFTCTYTTRTHRYSSFSRLVAGINKLRLRRAYLIQKGIHLATIQGRPIDYRVKYVKADGVWTYRSMLGRWARRGLFVTNLARGGSLMPAAEGIRRSLSSKAVRAKKKEMRRLTKRCTSLLESRFPGVGQLGYDYGIDRNGHIWILEVNTRPQ